MDKKEYSLLIEEKDIQQNEYAVYRRRWYILSMYTTIAFLCNFFYNTWTPISEPCKIIFGWQNWQVLLINCWAPIGILVSSGPSVWLMNASGLRKSVISCAFVLTLGKAFQIIPSSDPLTRTILLNIGQCIALLSASISIGAPTLVSATWFPPKERTTATAISTLVALFGIAAGFLVGPNMVRLKTIPSSTHTNIFTNHTVYDIKTMKKNLSEYIGIQLGVSVILLVCVLVHFPDRPPLPPSVTSSSRPHDHKKEFKTLLCDRRYLYLGLLFSMSCGVYFGWLALLALAVRPFGIGESLAAWIGIASVMAGIGSGITVARLVDYIKHHTKTVLVFLFLGTTISQLLFTLTCSKIIPFSKPLLFSSIILGGFFYNATTPLLFEMAVETVYPIAESLSTVLLLIPANAILLFLSLFFMLPWMNIAWINWILVIVVGLSVPGLIVYKSKYKRLELE